MAEQNITGKSFTELIKQYAEADQERIQALISEELQKNSRKIIVLDDDPTGVQTVHGVSVYTSWGVGAIEAGFDEPNSLFFILTNSRGMTAEETAQVHRDIGSTIAKVSKKKNREFILISRSDSTLRGHYPLETVVLREAVEKELAGFAFDGEIICPFFVEGGRYTAGNVHYVRSGDTLTPAAQTEFAKDKTFGYSNSDLTEWVEEKTAHAWSADGVALVSLEKLRALDIEGIGKILEGVKDFGKVVVNALDYGDIKVFCIALYRVLGRGKHFIIRSAAAIPKVLGGIPERPLLSGAELIDSGNSRGGLIVIGSHVRKTSRQLELLLEEKSIAAVEFNTHLVMDDAKFQAEIKRVQEACNNNLETGKNTAVYTRRDRFDLNTGNKEDELKVSMKIAGAVTSFVSALRSKPRFIISKGGITSSEIGTSALAVKKALVLGQILPGIPVWLTGPESRFPNMPYIIFPGNVGEEDSLKVIVEKLKA